MVVIKFGWCTNDKSNWAQTICRLSRFLGKIVTANRRRAWPLDYMLNQWIPGFIVYQKLQAILLFGRRKDKETVIWHPRIYMKEEIDYWLEKGVDHRRTVKKYSPRLFEI